MYTKYTAYNKACSSVQKLGFAAVTVSMNKLSCETQIYNLGVAVLWPHVTTLLILSKRGKEGGKKRSIASHVKCA